MRVLWVVNLMPPAVGEQLGEECSIKEGWISGLLGRMITKKAAVRIELGIAYPVDEQRKEGSRKLRLGDKEVFCYGFWENTARPELYEEEILIQSFQKIFLEFQPDILHLFGTEYGHSLAAARSFGRPMRTLIGIQGVIGECAKAYLADLPPKVYRRNTFRDWWKQDGILRQQEKFFLRGEREKEAFIYAANVTGRTEFDRIAAQKRNPHANYFAMNETLREEFYSGRWSREGCISYRIFFSQADYPLKGFHYLLMSMAEIRRVFPEVTVAVAGNSLVRGGGIKESLKISAYGSYLKKLIKENEMEGRIEFLGRLSPQKMKEEYLKCHTFICSSSLENSPNSLGEAMCLGVPVIAAKTGGIPSMLEDGKEGILYPKGNVHALAEAIISLWKDEQKQEQISKEAERRGKKNHDGEKNFARLLEIYGQIMKKA